MAAEPFRVITDDAIEEQAPPQSALDKAAERIGIEALMLGLGALSKRTLVALSNLFTLLTVASAFALWWRVLPEPSVYQLAGLTIYAVFLLIVNWLVRR